MSDTSAPRPIGTFLSILPEKRAVMPEPARHGWLRVQLGNSTTICRTEHVIGVRSHFENGHRETHIERGPGATIFAGAIEPEAILAAIDEANGDGPGDAAAPGTWTAPADLYHRIVARRAALASAVSLAEDAEPTPELAMLREHARWLAGTTTHPRDWMLLLRDAMHEAADALLEDSPRTADRFIALARALDRDAYRLPAEAPRT